MSGVKRYLMECKYCGKVWYQERPTNATQCPQCGKTNAHILKPKE